MDGEALLIASSIYARFILGGVLLWAGIAKVRQLAAFENAVAGFDLLPRQLISVAARVIPPIEVGLGAFLIVGLGTRWTAAAALLLLGTFTLAALITLLRGHRPGCFCFGSSGRRIGWWTIHRDIGLMLLAGFVTLSHAPMLSTDSQLGGDRVSALPIDQTVVTIAIFSATIMIWLLIAEALKYRGRG